MTPRSLFAMGEWVIRSPPSTQWIPCPPCPPLRPCARPAPTSPATAAREIMRIYAGDLGERTKADKSPVTDADHAAEAIIVAGLRALTPDTPVVAEEEMAAGRVPEIGRRAVLAGRSARRHQGVHQEERRVHREHRPDRGRPADARHRAGAGDRHAVARRGGTGRRQERERRRLHARSPRARRRPTGLTACASRSHAIYSDLDIWFRNDGLTVAERVQAGSSLKFCLIAEGKADIYPRFGPTNEWDTAAGQGVLEAAGGEVVTTDGRPLALRQAALLQSAFHRPQQGGRERSTASDRRGRAAASARASWSPSRPRRSTAWAATPPTNARSPRSSRPRAGRSSIR